MAGTTLVTTQRGFLSQPCKYRDEVRVDLFGRTYSTDDHSIIRHGHDIFHKIFLIILLLRRHFFGNEKQSPFWEKKLIGKSFDFFFWVGGGGGFEVLFEM